MGTGHCGLGVSLNQALFDLPRLRSSKPHPRHTLRQELLIVAGVHLVGTDALPATSTDKDPCFLKRCLHNLGSLRVLAHDLVV